MNYLKLRRKTGMNQSEFWAAVGITQSGGSRYEAGRAVPVAVAALVELLYGKLSGDLITRDLVAEAVSRAKKAAK